MSTNNPPAPGAATLGSRVGAYVVDSVVATLVVSLPLALLVAGILGDAPGLVVTGFVLYPVVGLGYGIWMMATTGSKGWTPGKKVLGLRVVDAGTLGPIGIWRACGRQLLLGLLGPVNLVQLVTIPRNPLRQGWHDSAVRARVVTAAGLDATRGAIAQGAQVRVPVAPALPSLMGSTPTPAAPVPGVGAAGRFHQHRAGS